MAVATLWKSPVSGKFENPSNWSDGVRKPVLMLSLVIFPLPDIL
jgi:hypothetical protein